MRPAEKRALELSDIISFHFYGSYEDTILLIDRLKREYDRPIINTEWMHRITGNTVQNIFPLFYLERIGCYNWGLVQGFSQTFEPWGHYFAAQANGVDWDLTRWQHDLFRFNGHPYDPKEIALIKRLCKMADERDGVTPKQE